MKTKITLLLLALIVGSNFGFAQDTEECAQQLSIFDTYRKQKKYDDAYGPWKMVREKCPKYSRAIYAYGDDVVEHKIKNSTGAEKIAFIKDLLSVYEQYHDIYPSKFSQGKMLEEKAELSYKHRKELNLSTSQLYAMFDEVYTKDKKNFTSPRGLYTYFSLIVDLFDSKEKEAQQMFDKYDDVNEIIETLTAKYTVTLNQYAKKEEAGQELTKKEKSRKRSYESVIDAFEEKIVPSMDKKLGDRANCEVLVPLYQKDFEQNKENAVWLQRSIDRMYAKGCKEDPLFVKLVEQKNIIEPNATISYYLYLLTGEKKYLDQTLERETDPLKKAKLYKKLAQEEKGKRRYGKARQYYMEALRLNPSDGRPYIAIAAMYAKSANSCGDTNFNKRAVFWLAASTARKAGKVDGRLRKAASQSAANYEAKAPSKSDIFSSGMSGKTIKIGCWIGRSVTVPTI